MLKQSKRVFLAMLPLGAAIGLLAAAALNGLMPKVYESEATMEVMPFAHAPAEPSESSEEQTPAWLRLEIEKMKGRTDLEMVSMGLSLPKRWKLSESEALRVLKRAVLIQPIRDTNLVSIRVRHTNRVDARDIALEVAKLYQANRRVIEERDSARFLLMLKKALRDQEDMVEERRKVLATIVRSNGMIYKGNNSLYGELGAGEDQGAKNALQTFHQLEQDKIQLESQISSLLKYENEQLMVYASGLELPDNIIRQLLPQYQQAKRELEALKINGLGDDHPTVKAAVENISNMKRQLDEGVVNLRATLKAKLDLATERLKSVKVEIDQSRQQVGDISYADAKRQFETDQELLKAMRLKLIGDEISAKIPCDGADIHDVPLIGESPVSPNVPWNLTIGALLGILLSPLLGLAVIDRMKGRTSEPAVTEGTVEEGSPTQCP